jgi:HD-like signal output (HDOD) protein/CheY-like chemotaxis protein
MKDILFVDDDSSLLSALRRLFHPLREEWQMTFTSSATEALRILVHDPFDVIVTDLRMPEMDGIELLSKVRELHPEIVRIILSGQSELNLAVKSAAIAHQYLCKPVDGDTLQATVARATALKNSFEDPSLLALVSGIRSLPSVPALYRELIEQLQQPDTGVEEVVNIIVKDTAMTAKVLQLANSAFFGLSRRITSPKDAVIYMGIDMIKALAMAVNVFSQFQSSSRRFSIDRMARHSVLTGMLARKIASEAGASRSVADDSFMAGLLHEVGTLILVNAYPDRYDEALERAERMGEPMWVAEKEIFGTTHPDIGSYLLWLWGMPGNIVEAVAYQRAPSACPVLAFGPLAALHAACCLGEEPPPGGKASAGEADENGLDRGYFRALALEERVPRWIELADEAKQAQEGL